MSSKLVPFEYRSKNGTLLPSNTTVYVDRDQVSILGVFKKNVFDPMGIGSEKAQTGFFIRAGNNEYGSITVTEQQFRASFISLKPAPLFRRQFNNNFKQVLIPCCSDHKLFSKLFNKTYR
jgi:hypothetical protein